MHTATSAHAGSRQGLSLIIIAAILWGSVGVTTKLLFTISQTTPLSIGFFRMALSVPALLAACRFMLGRKMFVIGRRDVFGMILMGAMTALYQVSYFSAVKNIGVAAAALITLCSAPVIVATISALIARQWPSAATVIALACALFGTALLVGFRGDALNASNAIGALPALVSALSYSVVVLVSRSLAERLHPLQSLAIAFSTGALILLPFAWSAGLVTTYSSMGWGLLIYLGVVPTAFAYVLFITGMRHTSATAASICTLLEPLVSTVLACIIFKERFGGVGVLGGVFLAGAIAVLYGTARKHRR